MGSNDFFKRKSLLPRSSRNGSGPELDRPSTEEVFTRVTAVPPVAAEEHARRTMQAQEQAERAVTAPAPQRQRREPEAAETETIEPHIDLSPEELAAQPRPPAPAASLPELELDDAASGSALDFVDSHARDAELPPDPSNAPAPPKTTDQSSSDASLSDLYALGDFSGALELAERRLARDQDDAVARRYAQNCRDMLIKMYAARLGSLTRTPRVDVAPDQVRWLSIDHRAGFLLSLIDGHTNIEDILDVSGMPRLDALKILVELVAQKAVSFVD